MKLNNYELQNVVGGKISMGIASIIIGTVAFLIGLIDGLIRPLPCRK